MRRSGGSSQPWNCGPWVKRLCPLDQALGRVLAQDIAAPVDVPFFDRSNMDGYAVHAADTLGRRKNARASSG